MPLVKGSPAYLRKLERDRLRKRPRSGRDLKPGEAREPRKRVDPEGTAECANEMARQMAAWTIAPAWESAAGWAHGPFRVIYALKGGPRGASSM